MSWPTRLAQSGSGTKMPRLATPLSLLIVALATAGCCRDTVRQLAAVGPLRPKAEAAHRIHHDAGSEKTYAVSPNAASPIETGSVDKASDDEKACQGEHIAYQATRAYLENVGPKPATAPGDAGPCARLRAKDAH